jgi:membrane-associated phospholipid phosphatase
MSRSPAHLPRGVLACGDPLRMRGVVTAQQFTDWRPRPGACQPASVRARPVNRVQLTLALALACTPARALANDVVQPWQRLGHNLEEIYGWPNLLFHVSAVAVTPPMVYTVDEPVQEWFQREDPLSDTFGPVTLWVGGLAPILLPAGLYGFGLAGEHEEIATAGAAAIQAVVVQFVVVTTLKWLTDRAGPYPNGDPASARWNSGLLRDSKDADDWNFDPFDVEGGLRWPSGHTASNVALVSALVAFYPDELWIALVGYPLALAIGIGMVEGDYHWLSDVVAGALMGHVIGWVVGKNFRTEFDARREDPRAASAREPGIQLAPAPFGLSLAGQF